MGILVNKEHEQNDELSRRITADLREKAVETSAAAGLGGEDPDLAEDAEYLKDLKKTSRFCWVWGVLIVLAVISLISIILI